MEALAKKFSTSASIGKPLRPPSSRQLTAQKKAVSYESGGELAGGEATETTVINCHVK